MSNPLLQNQSSLFLPLLPFHLSLGDSQPTYVKISFRFLSPSLFHVLCFKLPPPCVFRFLYFSFTLWVSVTGYSSQFVSRFSQCLPYPASFLNLLIYCSLSSSIHKLCISDFVVPFQSHYSMQAGWSIPSSFHFGKNPSSQYHEKNQGLLSLRWMLQSLTYSAPYICISLPHPCWYELFT